MLTTEVASSSILSIQMFVVCLTYEILFTKIELRHSMRQQICLQHGTWEIHNMILRKEISMSKMVYVNWRAGWKVHDNNYYEVDIILKFHTAMIGNSNYVKLRHKAIFITIFI